MDVTTSPIHLISGTLAAEHRRDLDREFAEVQRRRLVRAAQPGRRSTLDVFVDSILDVFRLALGERPGGPQRPAGPANATA